MSACDRSSAPLTPGSDPYYSGYSRPRSAVGPVFRGFVIALGLICSLAALGWGGYRIYYIGRWLSLYASSNYKKAWVFSLSTLVEGVLLALVLAPIALTAVIYAIKRTPTGRWRWITTLIVGIVCFCIIIGMRGGSKVELDKMCENALYTDECTAIWAGGMGISAGVAIVFLLYTIFFTIFFYKNQAAGGKGGHVPVGMQPLIEQPYPFANQAVYSQAEQAYAPPPQQTAYDPYAPTGQYPYPTPYGTTYGNRELDDKDSVHSGAQSLGYAQPGAHGVGHGWTR